MTEKRGGRLSPALFFEMNDGIVLFVLILLASFALWLLYHEGLMKKPWLAVLCALLTALALALRASVLDMETGDYRDFLSRWVSYYRVNGGFRAFGTPPPYCNYHVPYLYFLALFSYLPVRDLYCIKLLSMVFDVLLAWAAMKLTGRVTRQAALRLGCFFAVLLWPTVFLNSALWGQCDSIYAAFILLGIWLALEDRPVLSLVMMALSFGFKLQAVFVLPIILVLLFGGKYRWYHLPVFLIAYFLLLLPAVLLGRPLWETLLFYLQQTDSVGTGLNYNSSSIFAIFWNIPAEEQHSAAALAICAAVLFLLNLLGIAWIKRRQLTDRAILCLSLLMAIGLPFLLPHMHDRYFYPADILSLILAFSMPPFFFTAPLVGFASFLGYFAYLSFYFSERGGHFLLPMKFGAFALLAALALTGIALAMSLPAAGKENGARNRSAKRKG